jgi:hypothetical protein
MPAPTRALTTVVALVTGALALALAGPGNAAPDAPRASDQSAARPLDDVPGMGLTPDAVARDEMISYWEAWKRDVTVQDCMRRAGFQWEPEVAYPSEAVDLVADHLGVTPAATGSENPAARNSRRAAALGATDRDRYFRRLLGESSATIAFVEDHDGALPPGEAAEDFASGGCRGAADARVGSLWNLRRQLGADLSARLQAARKAPEFAAERGRYQRCAALQGLAGVHGPADVDRALDHGNRRAAVAVDARCAGFWRQVEEAALRRAAAGVRTAHAAAVDRQQRRYADAVPTMRRDRNFLRFLAAAAGRA